MILSIEIGRSAKRAVPRSIGGIDVAVFIHKRRCDALAIHILAFRWIVGMNPHDQGRAVGVDEGAAAWA